MGLVWRRLFEQPALAYCLPLVFISAFLLARMFSDFADRLPCIVLPGAGFHPNVAIIVVL